MTSEAARHASENTHAHAGHGADAAAAPCPHDAAPTGSTAPIGDATTQTDAGCGMLDQFVLMLAGLIGVPAGPITLPTSLSAAGTPPKMDQPAIDFFLGVEFPPPRA